ncbi:MAG: serine protease [Myxococcales bacterium]|nr:MAG: serine protease [Myxococcales bacterium]
MKSQICFFLSTFFVLALFCGCAVQAEQELGVSDGQAIIGGHEAPYHPWMVAIIDAKHGPWHPYYDQICGGALIAESWVITAAHCIERPSEPGTYISVVGAHNLKSLAAMKWSHADRIYLHEDYDPSTSENDIALIHLKQAFRNQVLVPGRVGKNTSATVAGWGMTEYGGYPAILQEVDLDLVSDERCDEIYGALTDVDYFGDVMICNFAHEFQDSCSGDSGGPLFAGDTLVGIVSWGVGCRSSGIYTEVGAYQAWLQSHIPNLPFRD